MPTAVRDMTDPEIRRVERDGLPDYEPELSNCPVCDKEVPEEALDVCHHCNNGACKICMLYDEAIGEWFCDTSGPDDCSKPKAQRLLVSECRAKYYRKNAKELFACGYEEELLQLGINVRSEKAITDTVLNSICGLHKGYWFSGTSSQGDNTVLEFSTTQKNEPDIRIRITIKF